MIKKLFLPLFVLASFGLSALGTLPTYATIDSNPCEGLTVGNQEYAKCVNSTNYKKWESCHSIGDYNARVVCENNIDAKNSNSNNSNTNNGGSTNNTGTTTNNGGEYRGDYNLPTNNNTLPTEPKCDRAILGMVSWDCFVDFTPEKQDDITQIVAMIASNIFTDITVIASYLVVAYVIYGGYLYIFANGDISKIATGKKALNQAFIGLAITLSATIVVTAIRIALMHGQGNFATCATESCVSADDMVRNLIQWVIGVAGLVAAAAVVGGGIMYITSNGDSNKLQTAKNIIKYSLIGLVIVALAEIITGFMTDVIVDAKNDAKETSIINNIKEYHEDQKIA